MGVFLIYFLCLHTCFVLSAPVYEDDSSVVHVSEGLYQEEADDSGSDEPNLDDDAGDASEPDEDLPIESMDRIHLSAPGYEDDSSVDHLSEGHSQVEADDSESDASDLDDDAGDASEPDEDLPIESMDRIHLSAPGYEDDSSVDHLSEGLYEEEADVSGSDEPDLDDDAGDASEPDEDLPIESMDRIHLSAPGYEDDSSVDHVSEGQSQVEADDSGSDESNLDDDAGDASEPDEDLPIESMDRIHLSAPGYEDDPFVDHVSEGLYQEEADDSGSDEPDLDDDAGDASEPDEDLPIESMDRIHLSAPGYEDNPFVDHVSEGLYQEEADVSGSDASDLDDDAGDASEPDEDLPIESMDRIHLSAPGYEDNPFVDHVSEGLYQEEADDSGSDASDLDDDAGDASEPDEDLPIGPIVLLILG
ncbi:coiled-coil domain-containing protein 1-like isoform X1 [Bufo bufo]|uniref:coiled-coil domain-containing protein 1-like isoform X1 n=1 Tax=Bufo bufo TaxID=8384 RepID=UPI001ABECCA1|nr:coiled-coil domain-containing protein 1-like isoform X1 [Bufo bufo]